MNCAKFNDAKIFKIDCCVLNYVSLKFLQIQFRELCDQLRCSISFRIFSIEYYICYICYSVNNHHICYKVSCHVKMSSLIKFYWDNDLILQRFNRENFCFFYFHDSTLTTLLYFANISQVFFHCVII